MCYSSISVLLSVLLATALAQPGVPRPCMFPAKFTTEVQTGQTPLLNPALIAKIDGMVWVITKLLTRARARSLSRSMARLRRQTMSTTKSTEAQSPTTALTSGCTSRRTPVAETERRMIIQRRLCCTKMTLNTTLCTVQRLRARMGRCARVVVLAACTTLRSYQRLCQPKPTSALHDVRFLLTCRLFVLLFNVQ